LVYGFSIAGKNCGAYSKRSMAQAGQFVYWLGQNEFYVFDGSNVSMVPCPVRDFLFNNLDRTIPDAVFAASNAYFNEISWYFPTIGSVGIVTSYVKLNVSEQSWDYGTLGRSAWTDQSVIGAPIGADYNGLLQQHEVANNLDGVSMDSYAQTGWVEISKGQDFVFLERMLPDFVLSPGANPSMTLYFLNYVGDTPRPFGPYPITASTRYFVVRGRGRYVSMKVESKDQNSFWRLGMPHAIMSPAGRK
jgi:hypothetical protein